MTLASWFSSLKRSRRRQAQNGGRRNRLHVFDRSAFLEALEDRCMLSSVSFSTGSETVNETAGTFSIPVMLSGAPTVSTFASGFNAPDGLAFDAAGNLYVANYAGTNAVSKVTPTGVVSTFAPRFPGPNALAFDATGNLYVADYLGNTVSKVTPAGVVSPFAQAIVVPAGLAFDAGNLYVASYFGNTVSEVTPAGVVSTFASGFNGPTALAFDAASNLYVANESNGTVSEVTPAGVVSKFASGFSSPDGLAFDAAGNLYVANESTGTVSKVTPAGVVSTFTSGFSSPAALAFHAGNLYVANEGNGTVSQVSESVTVPFTLGGTAVSGTAFSGVTAGTLTFGAGQTSESITGKLLSDPGPSQTLTFTLGTPTADSALGSPSVNMLTITEPTSTPTPTPSPVPPVFVSENRVFSAKGKHRKLVGFEFLFNGALNAGDVQSTGNYQVTQKNGKKVKTLSVSSASYSHNTVTIAVGGFKSNKAGQVTIVGLVGADGAALSQIVTGL